MVGEPDSKHLGFYIYRSDANNTADDFESEKYKCKVNGRKFCNYLAVTNGWLSIGFDWPRDDKVVKRDVEARANTMELFKNFIREIDPNGEVGQATIPEFYRFKELHEDFIHLRLNMTFCVRGRPHNESVPADIQGAMVAETKRKPADPHFTVVSLHTLYVGVLSELVKDDRDCKRENAKARLQKANKFKAGRSDASGKKGSGSGTGKKGSGSGSGMTGSGVSSK